jgi:glycosyltransferase involved in cell wall biosynthesis
MRNCNQQSLRPRLQWPFQHVLNAHGRPTAWVLVHGPIVTQQQQEQFAQLRRSGCRFAGMSSYINFPQPEPDVICGRSNTDPLDYEAICEVWCHCFRDPGKYLTANLPHALLSASDFTDYMKVSRDAIGGGACEEEFDFLYVGARENWKRETKNWRLAGQCIPRLCKDLRLRAFIVGTPTPQFPPDPRVVFSASLAWDQLLACLSRARFLFVPNVLDASPRLLAEALCLNVPVVVNSNILGGWKYVNRFTGAFFDGEQDVLLAVSALLERTLSPRDWFRANYGPYLAGQRLLRLLKIVDSELNEPSYLCLAEPSADLVEHP